MKAWRDVDSDRSMFGVVLSYRGLSVYVGRWLFRVVWRVR